MSISNFLSQSIFSGLPGTLYRCRVIDNEPLLITVSPGVIELTGYSAEKLLGKKHPSLYDLVHPEDKERVLNEHRNFFKKGTGITIQYRIIDSNGITRWVKEIAVSDYNGKDEPFCIDGYIMDITDKKQYDDVVKTLAAYQHALNESAIVSLTDKKGKIIYANDKFIEASQYTRKELIGHTHKVVNSGYHSAGFFREMWETITSGNPWRGEIRNRAKDGSIYWVDAVITPVLNEEKEITQFLSIRNIITRQKEQEDILRSSEEQFRDIIQNTSDLIQSVDANGNIVFVNERWKKRLGYTNQDVVGKNIFQFIDPESRAHCESIFERIKKGEEINSVEIVFQSACGEKVICEANVNARFVNMEMVLTRAIFRDVTEARKYQDVLQRRQMQLKEAERQAKLGSWHFDLQKNTLEWSDETYRIFGLNRDFALCYDTFLKKVHPDDRELVNHSWQLALAGRKYDIEHRILVNGTEKWVRESAVLEFNDQREPLYCSGSVQDITEKKKVEIELLKRQQQLNEAQKIARVGSFEWNTSTNEVTGSAEMFNILGVKKTGKPVQFDGLFALIHPDDQHRVAEKIRVSMEKGNSFSIQFRFLTPDGKLKYLEVKRQKKDLSKKDNYIFIGTIQDISSFKKSEQEQFNAIIESEENERNRIAAELHDGVCQYLAAGKLIIDSIREMTATEKPELKQLVDKCFDVINESFHLTRHISHQLVPLSLNENGFLVAITEMNNLLNTVDKNRYGLAVSGTEKEPESHIAVNLYRIIQEFIRNSQKYSGAKKIDTRIHYSDSSIEIELSDNGKGFDLEKVKEQKGIGIFNMINRIESFGGKYVFTSKPGQGVVLKINTKLTV
jgi:PAS domain S-box-containing protein